MRIRRARRHNSRRNTKKMKKFMSWKLKNEFRKFQICSR